MEIGCKLNETEELCFQRAKEIQCSDGANNYVQ